MIKTRNATFSPFLLFLPFPERSVLHSAPIGATHAVTQVYAVTYPSHDDQATECNSYEDAERAALGLAEGRGLPLWYEESPQSGRRTLVKSFPN